MSNKELAREAEWTEETVKELWQKSGFDDDFLPSKRFRKIVADAHNAALAAARLEEIAQCRAISHDEICRLQDALAAEREVTEVLKCNPIPVSRADDRLEPPWYWHNIAKAHDCESLTDTFVELTKLRNERKPLVEALEEIREAGYTLTRKDGTNVIDDALAKVKDLE